jgi:hypothetical protein
MLCKAVDKRCDARRRQGLAAKRTMPRVIGEEHRRHSPYVDADALQRKPRGTLTDMAAHNL